MHTGGCYIIMSHASHMNTAVADTDTLYINIMHHVDVYITLAEPVRD